MARTTLISLRKNKGKSINQCLSNRIDYTINDEKTNEGKYVSSFNCDPKTADIEFMMSKKKYDYMTGREQKNDVIGYLIIQSFKPNEITPELANQVGYELVMSFTKGKHAFVVSTHTDKAHIHNHIVFNSTTINGERKFRNFIRSGKALAKISDRICLENNLSIIEKTADNKTKKSSLYKNKTMSHSQKLKQIIDDVLEQNPKDFTTFIYLMKSAGYEVKSGKHLAFKGKNQKKFIRLRSLGEEYSEEKIKQIIISDYPKIKKSKTLIAPPQKKTVNLLFDIQSKINEGKGAGYERWAKIFNLKQMAQTVNFLRENNLLSYEKLTQKSQECCDRFEKINSDIKSLETKITDNKLLQNHIYNYLKTRDIYTEYRKSGYSKSYLEMHPNAIDLHKNAKAYFDTLDVKKLPSLRFLREEFSDLVQKKNACYAEYKTAKNQMQEIEKAKINIDLILEKQEIPTQERRKNNQNYER